MVDRSLLVIADIGGYTRFLTVHKINLAHAQDVVGRLLESVIDGAQKLKLSKLEGDAAFFYCPVADKPVLLDELKGIRAAFVRKKHKMNLERLCSCEGCTQVQDLTLKFVVHEGDVAIQKVKRYTELAGLDVIMVHRLLKNHVPIKEYALGPQDVMQQRLPDVALTSSTEDLEGIGPTATAWFPLSALGEVDTTMASASAPQRFFAWAGMTWRALPYMTGAKKACDGFQNMKENLDPPAAAAPSTIPPK